MKTRHIMLFAAAAALSLLLVSCFWQGGGSSGSLSFSISPRAAARSVAANSDTLRVYLMGTDGKLVSIGPAAHPKYDEVSFTPGSASVAYTSPAIPAGGPYSVLIALGKSTGGVLAPSDYGHGDDLNIAPGVSSAVTLTLDASPITALALPGTNTNGLVVVGGNVYASTSSSLFEVAVAPLGATPLETLPDASYTINSLSLGAEYDEGYVDTPWLNTNKGILPYSLLSLAGNRFKSGFATSPGNVNVLQSSFLEYTHDSSTFRAAMYQREAGLGGTLLSNGNPDKWIDVNLGDILAGKPILDSVPHGDYAYFATNLGAFRLDANVIGNAATAEDVISKSTFFDVTVGGAKLPILSLAIVDGSLYMGTSNGVYVANLTETTGSTTAIAAASLIAGTQDSIVTRIKGISYGASKILLAFMADKGVFLWSGSNLATLPFYCGLPADLPGEINTVDLFLNGGTDPYLLVAGKKGLVAYKVP